MTESNPLSEAILLRLSDRLVTVEHEAAIHTTSLHAITNQIDELRSTLTKLTGQLEDMRRASESAMTAFDQMRQPLQGLLDLRERVSGVWLVVTALAVVFAYLFQPLLAEFYRWKFGGN